MSQRGLPRTGEADSNSKLNSPRIFHASLGVLKISWWRTLLENILVKSKHLKGHLDPPFGDVTFFGSKEVSWIPLLVTSHFWTKGCQFDSPVTFVTFLDHSWDPLRIVSVCLSFCNILSKPPIFEGLRLSVCNISSSPILIRGVCLFVTFYPHHQFNQAEHRRRKARRWEHPKTVFWPNDPV